MKMRAMLAVFLVLPVLLGLSACERKGGNPPKPVTSSVMAPVWRG